MSAPSKPCHYDAQWGHLLRSHGLNCKDTECRGCVPCTHDEQGNRVRHCEARASCGQHLDTDHPHTCPRCIGRVRANITWISRNAPLLTYAAIEDGGVETEAAMLAGPAADPWVWSKRRAWQLHNLGIDGVDEEDPHHPFSVLGRWEQEFRGHYQQPPTRSREAAEQGRSERWTSLVAAAGYLFEKLTVAAQDPGVDWAQFATEVYVCRTHMEDILNTARRPETGAPCPVCPDAPPLRKVYAHWCAREDCEREHDTTGATDRWRCPVCKATWSEAEYRLWVADDYLDNADALTATDIQIVYGIPASTIRRWASSTTKNGVESPPKLRPAGRAPDGRRTYPVAKVLELRDTHSTRKVTA